MAKPGTVTALRRRQELLLIDPLLLIPLLTGKDRILNIPTDARVVNVTYVWNRNALAITLEHEDFTPMSPGDELPVIKAETDTTRISQRREL